MENYQFENYPTSAASNPNCSPPGSSSKRHPIYRGIRMRGGKWVTEIREPGTTTRIWLGTYPTPEMAATAYDVAAIALKGSKAIVNFPECVHFYTLPASRSANDIRAAASAAAAAANLDGNNDVSCGSSYSLEFPAFEGNESSQSGSHQEFIDEEALFDMPNLLMDMAGGMLVSPPRLINNPPSHYAHSPDHNSGAAAGNLWGYSYPYYYE